MPLQGDEHPWIEENPVAGSDQHTRRPRQTATSSRPRNAHSRARRKAARQSQPSAAGGRRAPVIVVGYDATPEARAGLADYRGNIERLRREAEKARG